MSEPNKSETGKRRTSETERIIDSDKDAGIELIDRYFSKQIQPDEFTELEKRLSGDESLRVLFVHYSQFASDLGMSARSHRQAEAALEKVLGMSDGEPAVLDETTNENSNPSVRKKFISSKYSLFAIGFTTSLVLGLILGFWWPKATTSDEPIAWLVNAHDCTWVGDFVPSANMKKSDVLVLESGLVQIRFGCGADVLVEGPAEVILLSEKSAKLNRGKISVKVPKHLKGFEVLSPLGRVLDLGTEFGVSVSADGTTDVTVFDGVVETFVGDDESQPTTLLENESASISKSEIKTNKSEDVASAFVRKISDLRNRAGSSLRPISTSIIFDGSCTTGLLDTNNVPVGFDSRLPGTGTKIPSRDESLSIDTKKGLLRLTTTRSDINRQVKLSTGEYVGFKLSDFGFTGSEDFSVTVEIPNIPNLENFGQVGLYCGLKSDKVVRGGFIKWGQSGVSPNTLFMVNNNGGNDSDSNKVGLLNEGIDLKLTLSRISNEFSLTAENLTDGGSASLSIRHPRYLDGQTDLHVGVFGANPFSDVRKTVSVKKFMVNIWK